jgi:hypothetical protein
MTNEIADDHTGVTERHAYRRQYDDRSDFTFYVDHGRPDGNYNVLRFFENWMAYVVGEEYSEKLDRREYSYKIRWPKDYQSETLYLNKFERDYQGSYLEYRFLQAYPISISSMPVSYDSSQLLKCTVSFTYTRYIITSKQIPKDNSYANALDNAIDAAAYATAGAIMGSALAKDVLGATAQTPQISPTAPTAPAAPRSVPGGTGGRTRSQVFGVP